MKYIIGLCFYCEEIIPDKNVSSNVLLCRYTAIYRVDVLTRTTVRCRIHGCSHCSLRFVHDSLLRRRRYGAVFPMKVAGGRYLKVRVAASVAVRPGIARLGNEPNSRNLVTGPWSDNQSSR